MKQKGKLKVTILGTGTSQGVPVVACNCEVCLSNNTKDKRLRASIMFTIDDINYVIDTGPDFRQQMLRENVQSLEAVIFTHEHKDHVAGLDDVRAFNHKQDRDMPIYCNEMVELALRREFHYVFSGNNYPGIPQLQLNRISKKESFFVAPNVEIIPIEVMHYNMHVLGFRIGKFAYITDAKTISDEEIQKLKGVEVLIVNALRKEEHVSHFNLTQALEFIEKVKPKQAYLTHISHVFGKHDEISSDLPSNVEVAYDGMLLEIN